MKSRTKYILVGIGIGAIAPLGFTNPAHAADFNVYVGEQGSDASHTDDFIDSLSDTRATGHYSVLPDGSLLVRTEGNTSTDKVAEYFYLGDDLADVGEPSLTWYNTPGFTSNVRPGMQLVVDFDGDLNTADNGILVGEPVYADGSALYGNDWWLSNGSPQAVKDNAPSHTGGFGSTNHGTLDEWRAKYPDAIVAAYGFSLGSGVFNSGTIASLDISGDSFTFTSEAPPAEEEPTDNGGTIITPADPTNTTPITPTQAKPALAETGAALTPFALGGTATVLAGLALLFAARARSARRAQ